jgi:hypothetical protein
MMEERKFYVYVHRRKSDNQPFYVGKGYGRRAYETSEKRRSKHWVNVARKHGVYVEMYKTGLTEEEAFSLEKEVIARLREQNCPLVNVADGGQGGAGIKMSDEKKALLRSILLGHKFNVGRKWSEETKKRMSDAQKKRYADGCKPSFIGRQHTPMTKELIASKLRGRKFSEETKEKMRAARIGKTMPEETKAKLKQKNSGKNSAMYGVRGADHPAYGLTGAKNTMSKAVRCIETGQVFESISLAARHFRENGYPKASHQPIASSIGKPNRTAYGYTWEYV